MFRLNLAAVRAFETRDLRTLVAIHNDLDLELATQPTCQGPRMEAEFKHRLLAGHAAGSSGNENDREYAIARADDPDQAMIGIAGVYEIDLHNGHAEIGVTIADADSRNLGIGIDVYILLTMYAMQIMRLNKVYGKIKASNTQARGTMLRLGLTEEAVLREHRYVRGRWEDLHVYSLLASEWSDRLPDWRAWKSGSLLAPSAVDEGSTAGSS